LNASKRWASANSNHFESFQKNEASSLEPRLRVWSVRAANFQFTSKPDLASL